MRALEMVGNFETVSKPVWKRRTHMAKKPFDKLEIPTTNSISGMKPAGFWYQWRRDWERWCMWEQPNWLKPWLAIVEVDVSRILRIRTDVELLDFERRYGVPSMGEMLGGTDLFEMWPKWDRLKEDGFAGIEIAPYLPNQRWRAIWYNPWDCASGVVWDESAIRLVGWKERKPMKRELAAREEMRQMEKEMSEMVADYNSVDKKSV